MKNEQKILLYKKLKRDISALLHGETNLIAKMATIVGVLKNEFSYFYWCGFYLQNPDIENALIIGPYQGTLGCLHIPFGKGVCGTVAQSLKSKIVDDVHTIENHISCDEKSQSEIVIPVIFEGKLIAVLDVDSDKLKAFCEIDRTNLEEIIKTNF